MPCVLPLPHEQFSRMRYSIDMKKVSTFIQDSFLITSQTPILDLGLGQTYPRRAIPTHGPLTHRFIRDRLSVDRPSRQHHRLRCSSWCFTCHFYHHACVGSLSFIALFVVASFMKFNMMTINRRSSLFMLLIVVGVCKGLSADSNIRFFTSAT